MLQSRHRKQGVSAVSAIYDSAQPPSLTYPVITSEDFKQSLDNYSLFVHEYNNTTLVKLNNDVDNHNSLIDKMVQMKVVQEQDIFKMKDKYDRRLRETYGRCTIPVKLYNAHVNEFNADNRVKIRKKKHHKVKQASKQIFAAILSHCAYKLKGRNLWCLQANESTQLRLDEGYEFPLSAKSLLNVNLDLGTSTEVPKLDLDKDTIHRHIARLLDCGVIEEYRFRGYDYAPMAKLNPLVLRISDGYKPYEKYTDTGDFTAKYGYNNSSYSNQVQHKNNKATAKADAIDKEELEALKKVQSVLYPQVSNSAISDPNGSEFYRNTGKQVAAAAPKEKKAAAKKRKEIFPIRESFRVLYNKSVYELANELAAGIHNNYRPLPMRDLIWEAQYGTIDKEQFRRIIIYDFICTTARIFKDKKVYQGEWTNTIKYFFYNYFFSKTSGIYSKQYQLEKLEEFRWRLKWVISYCSRYPDYKLLYPREYFNLTRTNSYEGGFGYTKKHFKKHENYLKNEADKNKDSLQKKKQRELTHKITLRARKYLKGRCRFEELTGYVESLEKKHHKKKGTLARALINILEVEKNTIQHAQNQQL
jgi:DNA-binding transcriptional ArsR family regulator